MIGGEGLGQKSNLDSRGCSRANTKRGMGVHVLIPKKGEKRK